jgi:type II secretory pathway predicted ATPase ExeA
MNLSVNMPMKQRINLIVEMNPLTLAKTREYVKHQMDLAKVKNEVFDEKCYSVIHSFTSGTPRRINQLCYQVLVNSYFESKVIVTAPDIEDLVKNMPHMFLGNNQNN